MPAMIMQIAYVVSDLEASVPRWRLVSEHVSKYARIFQI